jgi:hypothetical protein
MNGGPSADDRHLHEDHFDSDRGLLGGVCGEASLTKCQRPVRARVRRKPSGAVLRPANTVSGWLSGRGKTRYAKAAH